MTSLLEQKQVVSKVMSVFCNRAKEQYEAKRKKRKPIKRDKKRESALKSELPVLVTGVSSNEVRKIKGVSHQLWSDCRVATYELICPKGSEVPLYIKTDPREDLTLDHLWIPIGCITPVANILPLSSGESRSMAIGKCHRYRRQNGSESFGLCPVDKREEILDTLVALFIYPSMGHLCSLKYPTFKERSIYQRKDLIFYYAMNVIKQYPNGSNPLRELGENILLYAAQHIDNLERRFKKDMLKYSQYKGFGKFPSPHYGKNLTPQKI